MIDDITPWIAIFGAAVLTYSLRLGGLLMSDLLPEHGRFKSFMEILPGCLMVALVAPSILDSGISGMIAATLTAIVARTSKNVFVAMTVGMLVIVISRQLI